MVTLADIYIKLQKLKENSAQNVDIISKLNDIETALLIGISGGTFASPLSEYEFRRLDDSGNPQYFGYENKDGDWYIMRLSNNNLAEYYKSSTSDIDTEWANKSGFTYQAFRTVF